MFVGVALSVLTTLACGLAPALRAARTDAIRLLRAQEHLQPASRARRAFLSLQVAISLVLLVTAILFLRSVRAGLRTDLGFDPRPLAAVSVSPKFSGRHADNIRPYYAIIAAMQRMPGVIAVAAGTNVPLQPAARRPFFAGPVTAGGSENANAVMTGVGNIAGEYFNALGVRLIAGREFDAPPGYER